MRCLCCVLKIRIRKRREEEGKEEKKINGFKERF